MAKNKKCHGPAPNSAMELPEFDPLRAAELIEACRAHMAGVNELADVASRALYECYEYEDDEPQLGLCCDVVRHLLEQIHIALTPLGVVSSDVDPQARATEIAAGCSEQRRLLVFAQHVVRAIIHILGGVTPNEHEQVLPALRDIEAGIRTAIDGLERIALGLPTSDQNPTSAISVN